MATIISLPNELLHAIATLLPPTNQLAFKCTSHHLNYSLKPITPPKDLSPCARTFAQGILAFDRSRRMCALCKRFFPKALFDDNEDDKRTTETLPSIERENAIAEKMLAKGFGPLGGPGMIDLPAGCCAWHRPCLWSVHLFRQRIVRHPLLPDWVGGEDTMCMHCGKFRGDVLDSGCACPADLDGALACGCGTRVVRRYMRISFCSPWTVEGEEESWYGESGRILFFKRDRRVFVREWRGLDTARDILVAAKRLGFAVGRDRFGDWVDYPVEEKLSKTW